MTSKYNLKALIKTIKFINGRLQYDDYNGKIIHIHPELPNFKKKHLKFASDQIAKELYHKNALINWMEIIRLIEGGAQFSDASLIRSKWFEELAHEQLQKGGQFLVRRLKDLNKSKSLKTEFLETTINELKTQLDKLHLSKAGKKKDLVNRLVEYYQKDDKNEDECRVELKYLKENMFTKLKEIKSGFYNRPYKKNLESVDSLLPNECKPDHIYQMTIGNHHPIKVLKVR